MFRRITNAAGRLAFIWLICVFLLINGCEPRKGGVVGSASGGSSEKTSAGSGGGDSAIDQAIDEILKGDFASAEAKATTADAAADPRTAELAEIAQEYEQIVKHREQLKQEAYAEQMKELEKLREKIGSEPVDVNDIGEVLSVVIKTREYVEEDKKDEILEDSLVKKTINTAIEKGESFEADGRWIDAYALCYYWLSALDEENKEYKDKSERLMDMATIEMALKDDSCGDKSVDRHEGIRDVMFQRTLNALDIHYVSEIDYEKMAEASLERCVLLGEVLLKSQDELAFTIDKSKHSKWAAGIEAIQNETAGALREISKNRVLTIFDEVLALNEVTIRLPREVVVAQFSEAALASLDPFTNLIWPWNILDFQKNMTQQFTGIGVEISKATGVLKVASLLPDTPAYKSGLDADDEIVAVNGEPTKEMTIMCAVSKITGPKGTDVTLTIKHAESDKTEEITITRDKIVVPPIRGWQREEDGGWKHIIDNECKIGFIRVTAFTENTVPDTHRILEDLERDGLNGLIIDLRFNSGGYLTSASGLVNLFVKEGIIVRSKYRSGEFGRAEKATSWKTHPDYPIVVLINGQSASASEIVAGALQDEKFKRATLVGERSYGKGSVQLVQDYPGGGAQLKFTMAYYHLPSDQPVKNRYVMERQGRTDWGIAPDVEVKLRLNELRNMIDIQRENEVLAKADHDDEAAPMKRHSIEETLQADPQLAVSVLVLKAKMLQKKSN